MPSVKPLRDKILAPVGPIPLPQKNELILTLKALLLPCAIILLGHAGITFKTRVIKLSQPATFRLSKVYVPLLLKVVPCQV